MSDPLPGNIPDPASSHYRDSDKPDKRCGYFKGLSLVFKTIFKTPEEVVEMVRNKDIILDENNIRWLNQRELQTLRNAYRNISQEENQLPPMPDLKKAIANARNNFIAIELALLFKAMLPALSSSAITALEKTIQQEMSGQDQCKDETNTRIEIVKSALRGLSVSERLQCMSTWKLNKNNGLLRLLDPRFICDYFIVQVKEKKRDDAAIIELRKEFVSHLIEYVENAVGEGYEKRCIDLVNQEITALREVEEATINFFFVPGMKLAEKPSEWILTTRENSEKNEDFWRNEPMNRSAHKIAAALWHYELPKE